ncbi:MAG TPA: ABC transporter permease subunit [Thermomicrobiales bacterium]|nr:ABC transporter permease subunit [Thermomicrobiales bacterium]
MTTAPQPMPTPAPTQPTTQRYGEVFDRGYQHYEGERHGRAGSVWALTRFSMSRAMGLKKSWTAKVIPILVYVGAVMTAIIPVGIESFTGQNVMDYEDFFTVIFLLMGVFVATIAPEMLCGDRRENVLSLYFSRAITRLDYVLGKLLATALLTLTVSFVPAFILWLGRNLLADSPLQSLGDDFPNLLRIALAGILIAFYLGAGGLMIAAFTGRKAIAVAVTIVGFLVLETLANTLLAVVPERWENPVILLSPINTIDAFLTQLFPGGSTPESGEGFVSSSPFYPVEGYVAFLIGIVIVGVGVILSRYLPER